MGNSSRLAKNDEPLSSRSRVLLDEDDGDDDDDDDELDDSVEVDEDREIHNVSSLLLLVELLLARELEEERSMQRVELQNDLRSGRTPPLTIIKASMDLSSIIVTVAMVVARKIVLNVINSDNETAGRAEACLISICKKGSRCRLLVLGSSQGDGRREPATKYIHHHQSIPSWVQDGTRVYWIQESTLKVSVTHSKNDW